LGKRRPVEWVTREGRFATEVETRYIERGRRTRSRDAVNNQDQAGRDRLLERQLAGDTPTEAWDRTEEDRHMGKATSSPVERLLKDR